MQLRIRYKTRYKSIGLSLVLCALFSANALAQKSFTVVSADDGEAIPLAHIQYRTAASNESKTIICDDEGQITLPVSAKGGLAITIYHIGYDEFHANYNDDEPVKVQLKPKDEFLNEAIVTQQYSKRTAAKAVEKVQVINSKQIANTASVNLGDALQTQLAIGINQDNSTGTMVSMMGISGNNVKILVDGVPMIGRLDGNLDLSQINLNDIERIEVVEGPMSVSYGTNALAGVINLITKNASATSNLSGNVYSEFGAKYNVDLSGNTTIKKTGVKLAVGRNFFNGWPSQDINRSQQWKPKEQYFGRVALKQNFGKAQVTLKSEAFQEIIQDKGRPIAPYGENAFDQYFTTRRFDESLFISSKLDKHNSLALIFAFNYYGRDRLKYYRNLVNLTQIKTQQADDHDTSTFTNYVARGTWSQFGKNPRYSFQLGYDLNYQLGTGKRILDGQQGFADLALFASSEFKPWSDMIVKPGLRLAYNSSYKAPPTPMISIRQKIEHYTIRASYSRGFRAPEIKELYLDFVDVNHDIQGNPELEAEFSHNFIFSVIKAFYSPKLIVKPELSGFYNAINNKINLANTRGLSYTYVNIEEFKTMGTKFNLQVRTNKLKATVGTALIGISDEQASNTLVEGFSFYKEINLNVQYEVKGILVNMFYKYNGEQTSFIVDTESDAIFTRKTNAYHNLDFNLGKNFMNNGFTIFVGAKNLMDNTNLNAAIQNSGSHSSGNTSVPIGIGRTYFVKVSFQLNSSSKP